MPTSKVLPPLELPSFVIQAGFGNRFTKGTSIVGLVEHSGRGKILEDGVKNLVKTTSDVALAALGGLWGITKTVGAPAVKWFAEAEGLRKALVLAVVVYTRSQPTHSWINGGVAFPF